MAANKRLTPSLLSADAANLYRDAKAAVDGGADALHLDIMDGHFVPNLTFGPHVCACLSKVVGAPVDVHLMVMFPEMFIKPFIGAGAANITIHHEAQGDKVKILREIKNAGISTGISIKPLTPVTDVLQYLPHCDRVLLMTVEPGFGGQAILPQAFSRIKQIRALIDGEKPECVLQIDGGVTYENLTECLDAGADDIVAGSSVFKNEEITGRVFSFIKILDKYNR